MNNNMTKYILNSGGIRNNPELAKKFFAEMVKGFGNQHTLNLKHMAIRLFLPML